MSDKEKGTFSSFEETAKQNKKDLEKAKKGRIKSRRMMMKYGKKPPKDFHLNRCPNGSFTCWMITRLGFKGRCIPCRK